MSTKDLAAKYGKSNPQRNVNAAIRQELPGGSPLLDALELVHLTAGSRELAPGSPLHRQVSEALRLLREAKAQMEAEIRRRYDMPPAAD